MPSQIPPRTRAFVLERVLSNESHIIKYQDAIVLADELETELIEAQAEIARLKAGGCARDQRTTQFCGEALKLQERIETLEDFARKYRAAYEPPGKHLEHRMFPAEKAALDAYRKAMGEDQ